MREFAGMIREHQEGILNHFNTRATNATVEPLNKKAKAISHRAYGYRTAETFQLALYHSFGNFPEPNLPIDSCEEAEKILGIEGEQHLALVA
jgi:transposase